MKAAGQQMALGANQTKCDQIADGAKAVKCRVEQLNAEGAAARQEGAAARQGAAAARRDTAAAQQEIQVAQLDGQCAADVKEMRATIPIATERARELVKASGRPAAEYGICNLRDALRASLNIK